MARELSRVPYCKNKCHRRAVLIGADWLRLIAMCWQSVCILKLDGNYLHTFANLSECECSQCELDSNCLEMDCLPPDDTCSRLVIQSSRPQVKGIALFHQGLTSWWPKLRAISCWIWKNLEQWPGNFWFLLAAKRLSSSLVTYVVLHMGRYDTTLREPVSPSVTIKSFKIF